MLLVNQKSTMSELTQSSMGETHFPVQALVELQNSEPDKARRNTDSQMSQTISDIVQYYEWERITQHMC